MSYSTNNVVVRDASSRKGGASPVMAVTTDYILGRFWNGHFPINIQAFCMDAGLEIQQHKVFPSELETLPGCKWTRWLSTEYDNRLLIHPDKPLQYDATEDEYVRDWEFDLEIAYIFQWYMRDFTLEQLRFKKDEYEIGWKIAKRILMPTEVFYRVRCCPIPPEDVLGSSAYTQMCRIFFHIPPKEVEERFREILCR